MFTREISFFDLDLERAKKIKNITPEEIAQQYEELLSNSK